MNKNLKNCLIGFSVLFILFACSGISMFFGFVLSGTYDHPNSQKETVEKIVEKPVYIEQETSQRYIDENSPVEVYDKLLQDSKNHFTFTYKVNEEKQFQTDKNFILVNLENQHSRLSIKFNRQVNHKIQVVLTDTIDQYEDDLEFSYDADYPTSAAFAQNNDLIEIFINPKASIDKFYLANTLSHELVHIYQYTTNEMIYWDAPDWYLEGMAEYFAYPKEEPLVHSDTYKKIRSLDMVNQLILSPSPEEYSVGYDTAHLFFGYLVENYGDSKIIQLENFSFPTMFDENFKQIIGIDSEVLFDQWIQSI